MTHAQMRNQVQAWLGLQDVTMIPSYDEGTIVDQLLYQGTIDLLARTKCVVRCTELNVQANVGQYLLDHSILALVDVENGRRRPDRRNQVTNPGYDLIRADVLRIDPTPSEDGQVQVWGVLRPTPMTADGDSPADEAHGAIPEEWHDAIVTYAMWKAADYTDDAGTQGGEVYRILYEGQDGRGGRLNQIRIGVNKRGGARGSRADVRLRTVSRSGAYIG